MTLRLAVLILTAGTGCASGRDPAATSSAPRAICPNGVDYLEVTNASNATLSVYASQGTSSIRELLGTAGSGTTRFPLNTSKYAGRPAIFTFDAPVGSASSNEVRLRRRCDNPGHE